MTGKTGLLAVFSVALSVCHADLANPPRKTIAPDAAHAPGTRTHEGIPSFAASSANGRMWATWYASPTGGEDSNNYLVLATSEDGGRNWREVLVYDPDGAGPLRAFDPEIWVAPDGRLRWTWTERVSPLAAEAKNKYAGCGADPKNDRLVMAELDADVEPDVGALASPGNVREIARGVMMCKPLVTKNGDWILPVAHWGEAPSACVYASNDGGRTFVERGGVTLPKNKRLFDEHQIVQLEDGALRMYVRTKGEPDGIWEATSTDGGRTWSAPFPSALPHVSSRFFVCRLASGGLLMVKNGRPGEPGKGRCDMTAYLSSDDGKTWPHSLVLDAGRNGVSYPDGQQLADGTIAVVYDYDRVGSRQILLATFREEDIVSGKNVSGKLRLRHVVNKASGRPPRDGECIPATRPPGDSVLWPSEKTVLRAQPDSGIASLPDGAMGVTTGVKYQWPGVRMDFAAGACDLSKYGSVKVSVSNITDRTIVVHLGVKGEGREPGGNVRLMPHSSGELFVNLHNAPWVLDAPLKLEGMRGCPKMPDEGSASDLRRTRSFHIFLVQDGKPGGFSVRRVAASGMGVEPKVLPAKTFLPFVDEFGQFAHCDWPGKIHDADELIASRTKEEAWLKEHPCPIPDADKYGGWTGGPRLKATGFFRTEKVNGKWWLVDPEGLLFFSHGVDCVGVGEATGVGFREKYFSWLPKRDDPLFGRFWGKVSWPGAHGFYKDPSRIPFETFDFASANAARKYGRDWWRICAERVHERMRSWGLNTIANWTDCRIYGLRKTPYTANFVTRGPVIEGSSGWWGKFRDPFAPEFAQNAKKSAAEEAARSGEDPWCIGWFVDNELGFGKDDQSGEYSSRCHRAVRS